MLLKKFKIGIFWIVLVGYFFSNTDVLDNYETQNVIAFYSDSDNDDESQDLKIFHHHHSHHDKCKIIAPLENSEFSKNNKKLQAQNSKLFVDLGIYFHPQIFHYAKNSNLNYYNNYSSRKTYLVNHSLLI